MREASREMWNTRTLDRNIGSQYYYRLLQAPGKDAVIAEMRQLTAPAQPEKLEFMKNPMVAEFLQLPANTNFTESDLEKAIIKHLKEFLLEMGKGFAFMSEQYHIATDTGIGRSSPREGYINREGYNKGKRTNVLRSEGHFI